MQPRITKLDMSITVQTKLPARIQQESTNAYVKWDLKASTEVGTATMLMNVMYKTTALLMHHVLTLLDPFIVNANRDSLEMASTNVLMSMNALNLVPRAFPLKVGTRLECSLKTANCSRNSFCVNTVGGYNRACLEGYHQNKTSLR